MMSDQQSVNLAGDRELEDERHHTKRDLDLNTTNGDKAAIGLKNQEKSKKLKPAISIKCEDQASGVSSTYSGNNLTRNKGKHVVQRAYSTNDNNLKGMSLQFENKQSNGSNIIGQEASFRRSES